MDQNNSVSSQSLNYNANKVRWLTDTQLTPSDMFVLGSSENVRKVSVWRVDNDEVNEIAESCELDGDVTEIKAKNKEDFFVSTSSGSLYQYKYLLNRGLEVIRKWSELSLVEEVQKKDVNESMINNFDFDSGCDELCCVGDDGQINFISISNPTGKNAFSSFEYKETCSLNSVIYMKQYEIAVADSLGRVKLWDTRNKNSRQCSMNLHVDGECSPTICLANHPNQQHLVAAGNLNGLIFIYDVRSQKSPVIMTHNHSQPILEVKFSPFACDTLFSSSFDGALWQWNVSSKGEFASFDEKNIDAKNHLPKNQYTLNSFDINNENIIAVNNNYRLFRLKNASFM